ncbi:MAG: hypothetical protein CME88_09025 [Hirschia sp.]|nr:hypothetical protein [Hirschia sp.]MBF18505.1 hypothetical protein [Hirschia sp.]|tara:strand:- start:233 stop:466 length:234 start_codon:yes stop_codon:yes gene_type:complete
MSDEQPHGEAKVGRFFLRLAAAAAWFLVFWLVRFRTLELDISDLMRSIIAIFALIMGVLTLFWAVFARDDKNTPENK